MELRRVFIDQDRDDVTVEDVGHLIADGDDVQLVPLVRLEVRIDDRRFAQRREQARILPLFGAHHLPFPGDDAAPGGLLVELPGIAVSGVDIVLRAPHVPLLFGLRIRRRAARGAAWTRALWTATTSSCNRYWRTLAARRTCGTSSRASASRRVGRDPPAILNAAVDVPGAFHLHLQLEVGGFAALPDEIHGTARLLAGRFNDDGAVFDLPLVIARPSIQRAAVEERRPAVVFLQVERIRLSKTAAPSASLPWSAGRGRRLLARSGRRLWCASRWRRLLPGREHADPDRRRRRDRRHTCQCARTTHHCESSFRGSDLDFLTFAKLTYKNVRLENRDLTPAKLFPTCRSSRT